MRLHLFLFIIFYSCKTVESTQTKAIIGQDDRNPTSTEVPVGFLKADKVVCTGTAISTDEILTAKHCVDHLTDLSLGTFHLNGKKYRFVKSMVDDRTDIAIIKVDQELENFFPINMVDISYSKQYKIYSANKKNFEQILVSSVGSVEVLEGKNSFFIHTFDTERGTSGSPIVDGDFVVGLHLGADPSENYNIGVQVLPSFDESNPRYIKESCSLNNLGSISIKDCKKAVAEVAGCAAAASIAGPFIASGFTKYQSNLIANSKTTYVPNCLKTVVEKNFGLNFSYPTLKQNAKNTGSPDNAITLDRYVFFPRSVEFMDGDNLGDMHWLLHELEHVSQWKKKGVVTFLAEWVCDTGAKVLNMGTFNIHDSMKIEKAADAKADSLLRTARQTCQLKRNVTSNTSDDFSDTTLLKRGDVIWSKSGTYVVSLNLDGSALTGSKMKPRPEAVWTKKFRRPIGNKLGVSNEGKVTVWDHESGILWQSSRRNKISRGYRFMASDYSGGLVLQTRNKQGNWSDTELIK